MATSGRGDWDVVVVGAGLAGHCAALEAARRGARVLLLESQGGPGGSSRISAGFFAFAGTPLQRAAGVEDGPDRLFRDLWAVGGGASDPALLRTYAKGQLALHDWLVGLGARFTGLQQGGGQSVARAHRADPMALMACLARAVEEHPRILQRLSARATRLMRRDGAVAGVATAPAEEVMTAGAVVLATGGFSLAEDLLARFAPDQAQAIRVGGAGSLGDGLRMALPLGAGLRDMEHIKGTFGAHADSSGERYEALLAFYLGAVIVNRAGRRFVDEAVSYKLIGAACLRQTGAIGFQVFDQSVMERGEPGVPLFDFAAALAAGRLVRADTRRRWRAPAGWTRAVWRRRWPPTTPASRPAPARRAAWGFATAPARRRPWTARPSTPSRPGRPCSPPIAAWPSIRTGRCSARRGGR
ncbi:MAG: FAD-dependent oxidoreductase [Acetobacteraceae bacterium]|nr:FAD-dependent oxidoreductase [Acetobacteraceae bacterium]